MIYATTMHATKAMGEKNTGVPLTKAKCSWKSFLLGVASGLIGWLVLMVSLPWSPGPDQNIGRFAVVWQHLLDPSSLIMLPLAVLLEPGWWVVILAPAMIAACWAKWHLRVKLGRCMIYGLVFSILIPVIGMIMLALSTVRHG